MAPAVVASNMRPKKPEVNLSDMPELMPGAQPSANPAQREEFEKRCRKLYDDASVENGAKIKQQAASGAVTTSDLEAMFPTLDASLVHALAAEAPTPQHAMETLLTLAASIAEPVADGKEAQPRDLGVKDMDKFPSLCDADGWQVVSKQQLERDTEQELGSVWRDRAKAAVGIPAPRAAAAARDTAHSTLRRRAPCSTDDDHAHDQPQLETDYEFRQRIGQKRVSNRAQFGRGRGRGQGASTQASGNTIGSIVQDEQSVTTAEADDSFA